MNELKEFRERYSLTQEELGELIFYSASQIQRLENPDKKWGSKITPHFAKMFSDLKEKWHNVRPLKKH